MAVYDSSVWMVLRGIILAAYELMNLLSIGKSTTILDGICAMQQWGHCTKKGEGMWEFCVCMHARVVVGELFCKWLRVVKKNAIEVGPGYQKCLALYTKCQ